MNLIANWKKQAREHESSTKQQDELGDVSPNDGAQSAKIGIDRRERPEGDDQDPDARAGIGWWIEFYNKRRPHSSLGDQTPDEAYNVGAAPRPGLCPTSSQHEAA